MTTSTQLVDRLDEFEGYVRQNLSANEIAALMQLKMYQVDKLRTALMDKTHTYIPLQTSGGRGVLKASTSGISIARGRLTALGLDSIFPKGQTLQLTAEGGRLIISPIDSTSLSTVADATPVAQINVMAGNNDSTSSQASPITAIINQQQEGQSGGIDVAVQ